MVEVFFDICGVSCDFFGVVVDDVVDVDVVENCVVELDEVLRNEDGVV